MPKNVYSEINLHVVWGTKESRALIKPDLEAQVHDAIRLRAANTDGVRTHAIGGTPTHVHLAVTVPPTLEISMWIGQVKGGSSHDLNGIPIFGGTFEWQRGYGVISFGTKDLSWVVAYIRNQKQHHNQDTWEERLERIVSELDG